MFKNITSVLYEFSALNPLLFGALAYFLVFFLQLKYKSALSIFTEDDSNVIFHNSKLFAFRPNKPEAITLLLLGFLPFLSGQITLLHANFWPASIP